MKEKSEKRDEWNTQGRKDRRKARIREARKVGG